jgi:hypothetical protein
MSVAADEFQVYPPYVLSEADRERWDLCHGIAEKQVELYGDGPDARYVWMMTRWFYATDVPTGTQADQDAAAKIAGERRTAFGAIEEVAAALGMESLDPARALWETVAETPPAEIPDTVADVFDALFGNPDVYSFAEYERLPSDGTRMGDWLTKLDGMRAFVATNREAAKVLIASHLAVAAQRFPGAERKDTLVEGLALGTMLAALDMENPETRAVEAGSFAMDHRHELVAVMHGAGHLVQHVTKGQPTTDWVGVDAAMLAEQDAEDLLGAVGL